MSGTAVEQVKERLSILDVVGGYVQLHKAGKHYKGKSPFSDEKTPSFFVSPDRGVYYCFSTNKGGDIFTFIEEMEGVDFKEALRMLAERAGVELTPESKEKKTEREMLFRVMERAALFFSGELKKKPSVVAYLKDRGVSPKTATLWQIGYAPDDWRVLKDTLEAEGFSEALLLKAGLIKKTEEGKRPYDVFRNRVMFPIYDASGRVVAFSGRILGKTEEGVPKYVNSPETTLYNKSEVLFGYHKAKQGIRTYDFSLVVEGQFDLVLAHQAGYTNTVAVSGTALTPHHVSLLGRLSSKVVLALDADRAGIASMKRAASLMLPQGMDVKVAHITEGKDPADLVLEDPKLLKEAVGKGEHVVPFLVSHLKKEVNDERTFRLRVRDEVLPFLAQMPNKVDREYFEEFLGDALKTTKESVHFEVERILEEHEQPGVSYDENVLRANESTRPERVDNLRDHLLGVYAWQQTLTNPTVHIGRLKECIVRACGEEVGESVVKEDAIFRIEMSYGEKTTADLVHLLEELLKELYLGTRRRRLVQVRMDLQNAERGGDEKEIEGLLEVSARLQKELGEVEDLSLHTLD